MIWREGRHDQVADERYEWWQDLWDQHTGSRVVLLSRCLLIRRHGSRRSYTSELTRDQRDERVLAPTAVGGPYDFAAAAH